MNKNIKLIFIKVFVLLLFTLSITMFYIGYHAVDTSYNILKLSYQTNNTFYDDYIDMTIGGDYLTMSQEYIYGWKFCLMSLVMLIYLSWITIYLVFSHNDKNNRRR